MSSSLGKRKERDEDPEGLTVRDHGSTLFVSNLPYTATSTDLQTLFSDLAPVRSAFVVTEQGTGNSKGVGYVAFAIKEDAQVAFDTITRDGISLNDRKLRIQWADSKPKEKQNGHIHENVVKKEGHDAPMTTSPRNAKINDPLAIRTILVSGLPLSIDSKSLWKKIRKYEGAEKVDWPANDDHGKIDPATAHVLFSTSALAQNAVTKLHAHVFKGSLLSVTLKKRLDKLAKPSTKKKVAAPSHASRLIVRNLPFDMSEQDLRAVFLPYGPIYSVHLPTISEEGSNAGPSGHQSRTKGFAFVWMLSKTDAERAIQACNGIKVRAGMAEGLVSDKQKKKKQRREEKKQAQSLKVEGDDVTASQPEDKGKERVIAVDWALSKDKWEEQKAKRVDEDAVQESEMTNALDEEVGSLGGSGDDNVSNSESEDDSDDDDGRDDDDNDDDSDSDTGQLGVHFLDQVDDGNSDSADGEEEDDSMSREGGNEEPVKPHLPPPESGTTLFIRNVPFEATEDELRVLFRSFGPLRYARITLDPSTGRSRGTGFACFWNKADADKVVEQSDLLRVETAGSEHQPLPKANPFTLPSILTPDPSSSLAKSLVLHGRTLDVVRAVTRDEAGKLKEEGEKRREKADKRNLYLLREGVILPNTPAAKTLTSVELEQRTNSFNARRALLRSNPSLYISKTRLSVRQIPIFVTERVLKRLSIHAVRTFEAEVRKGIRSGLSPDELAEVVKETVSDSVVKEEEGAAVAQTKTHKSERRTGVKQAKIVRQSERVDPISGKGRSKGYGFVEMLKHADALRVLRWANNNAQIHSLLEKWWKEELEDLVRRERAKEDKDQARLKRMEDELKSGRTRSAKGNLIVEFSIENIQVVHRRAAYEKEGRMTGETKLKGKVALNLPKRDYPKSTEPAIKKLRLMESLPNPDAVKPRKDKAGQAIGSLIGRKRKERKVGKR